MKLIDAKISGYAITSKDLMKYPFGSMNRIVEFWIFEGNSRVKIYHNDEVIVKQIHEFDENNIDKQNYDKILIYRNADELMNILKKKINDAELISYFENKIAEIKIKRTKEIPRYNPEDNIAE